MMRRHDLPVRYRTEQALVPVHRPLHSLFEEPLALVLGQQVTAVERVDEQVVDLLVPDEEVSRHTYADKRDLQPPSDSM